MTGGGSASYGLLGGIMGTLARRVLRGLWRKRLEETATFWK
ncbi:MAG: hypothetical protein QXU11_02645 [Thermoproteota archaeon]